MESQKSQTLPDISKTDDKMRITREYILHLREESIVNLEEELGPWNDSIAAIKREDMMTLTVVGRLIAVYMNAQEGDLIRTWIAVSNKMNGTNDSRVKAQLSYARDEYVAKRLPLLPQSRLRFLVEHLLNLNRDDSDGCLMAFCAGDALTAGWDEYYKSFLVQHEIGIDDIGTALADLVVEQPHKYARFGQYWGLWII